MAAALAGTALVLARESPAARPAAASANRIGLLWRRWPSLIRWTMAWSPEVRLPSPTPPHQIRRQP